MATGHTWKFFRAGGFNQVRLETGADIKALAELDQKLWVALACPTKGLEFDAHTLDLLDSEKDGRVRVPEVVLAAKWTCGLSKNPDELVQGAAELPLASIDDSTDEGRAVLSSAKEILKNLGKADAKAISPADTVDTAKIFSKTLFNGDGIVPPESAGDDAATAQALAAILTGFFGLKAWQMPLAAMKLRQRNLGPLLDANGWAINTRARINIPFGSSLTAMAKLPPGTQRSMTDPYADKKRPWGLYLFIFVALDILYWLSQKGFIVRWWDALTGGN